jgi:hypothetical protein
VGYGVSIVVCQSTSEKETWYGGRAPHTFYATTLITAVGPTHELWHIEQMSDMSFSKVTSTAYADDLTFILGEASGPGNCASFPGSST